MGGKQRNIPQVVTRRATAQDLPVSRISPPPSPESMYEVELEPQTFSSFKSNEPKSRRSRLSQHGPQVLPVGRDKKMEAASPNAPFWENRGMSVTSHGRARHSSVTQPTTDAAESHVKTAKAGRSYAVTGQGKDYENVPPPPSYNEVSAGRNVSSFLSTAPSSFPRTRVEHNEENIPLSMFHEGAGSPSTSSRNLDPESPDLGRPPQSPDPDRTAPLRRQVQYDTKQVHIQPFAKFYLFFSNVIATLLALGLISIGSYAAITQGSFKDTDLTGFGTDPAVLMIALGVLVLIVGGSGLIGSLRENYSLLRVFNAILLFLMLAQVVGGLLIYFLQDKVKDAASKQVINAISKYQTSPRPTALDDALIQVQMNFQCCGAWQPRDWRDNSPYFDCSSREVFETLFSACSVPASCCQMEASTNSLCGYKVFSYPNMTQAEIRKYPRIAERNNLIWSTGCVNALYDWLKEHWVTLAITYGIILLVQILAVEASKRLMNDLLVIKKRGYA